MSTRPITENTLFYGDNLIILRDRPVRDVCYVEFGKFSYNVTFGLKAVGVAPHGR